MSGNNSTAQKVSSAQQRLFRLTDIPDVMQYRLGWTVAAQLMRRWLTTPAYEMTREIKLNLSDPRAIPAGKIDEKIVTMPWAFRHIRVGTAYTQLLNNWDTPNSRTELKTRINQARLGGVATGNICWKLGDLSQPGKVLDRTCQINMLSIGHLQDPLDDFYGALGKATLKLAVSGMVSKLPNGRDRIAIDQVGVYLRDTYDFNDDSSFISQPLGYWGYSGVSRGFELRRDIEIDETYVDADTQGIRDRTYAVQNDDFRRYRKKDGRGGDFVIYSDVHVVQLPQPKILEL